MFTEDYLMRIINQAIAALMTAIGLRKAGKYSEARQAILQAIEQLTTLPANLVEQMEDGSLLNILRTQGLLDAGRLAILGDLYMELAEILFNLDQAVQGSISLASALRFYLEAALSDADNLSTDNIGKVVVLLQRLEERALPVETQLALSDYYQRVLEMDDQSLVAAGTSRTQVSQRLSKLQDQLGQSRISSGT
jgi:hypothetical protein